MEPGMKISMIDAWESQMNVKRKKNSSALSNLQAMSLLDSWLGCKVGHLRILEHIGRGGFADVYLAEHELVKQKYAVKLLRLDRRTHPHAVTRFRREAQLLARLSHPGIVRFHDFSVMPDEACYLMMEYLHGETLKQRLQRKGALSCSEVERILTQLCVALSYIHEQGVIHRDLKPENIYLVRGENGAEVVKLFDFGIAAMDKANKMELESHCLSGEQEFVGTFSYSAPEQLLGHRSITIQTDLYAVGAILFFMLTGEQLFADDEKFDARSNPLRFNPRSLSEARPQLKWSVRLESFLHQVLNRVQEKRPKDSLAFRQMLAVVLEEQREMKLVEEMEKSSDKDTEEFLDGEAHSSCTTDSVPLPFLAAMRMSAP